MPMRKDLLEENIKEKFKFFRRVPKDSLKASIFAEISTQPTKKFIIKRWAWCLTLLSIIFALSFLIITLRKSVFPQIINNSQSELAETLEKPIQNLSAPVTRNEIELSEEPMEGNKPGTKTNKENKNNKAENLHLSKNKQTISIETLDNDSKSVADNEANKVPLKSKNSQLPQAAFRKSEKTIGDIDKTNVGPWIKDHKSNESEDLGLSRKKLATAPKTTTHSDSSEVDNQLNNNQLPSMNKSSQVPRISSPGNAKTINDQTNSERVAISSSGTISDSIINKSDISDVGIDESVDWPNRIKKLGNISLYNNRLNYVELTYIDVINSENLQTETNQQLLFSKLSLRVDFMPFVNYNRLTPNKNDNKIISEVTFAPQLSSDRLGFRFNLGFDYRISNKLSGFLLTEFQSAHYEYSYSERNFTQDSVTTSVENNSIDIQRQPLTVTYNVSKHVLSSGLRAGINYDIFNSRNIKNSVDLSFAYQLTISSPSFLSKNQLLVSVGYRFDYQISNKLGTMLYPSLSYNLINKRLTHETLTIKPQSIGLGVGLSYKLLK